MSHRFTILALVSLLSGCSLLKGQEYHQTTLSTIEQSEAKLQNSLTNLALHISNQQDYIDSLEQELRQLTHAIEQLQERPVVTQIIQSQEQEAPISIATADEKKPSLAAHEMVLGEIEKVTIDAINKSFDARIDTGAATSSLNAVDIEEFERNGKNWVRFHLSENEQIQPDSWIEAPIVRHVRIRQSTNDNTERRAVVELWVKLGPLHEKAQFTLADRSQMNFSILLGREFIRDIAVVDVSRKYIQSEK